MPASNFEGASLSKGPSPKVAEIWIVTDGFPPSNVSGNAEAMSLSYLQDKGGVVFEDEDQKLADEGSQNFLIKAGLNYPILLNDNVTWNNCLLEAAANRSQVFVKNDDGDCLNFVRDISNDYTGATTNGSRLVTWNGMKRTISATERKIELIGQTGLWLAEYLWQNASAQTAGYIATSGNISGGTPLGLASISGLTPLFPGFWQVSIGGAVIGELTECTMTETVMGNALQFNQFECRDLEVSIQGKGIQVDGVQRLAAGYQAFNQGAVVLSSTNGEVFTFTSGSLIGQYKVTTHGNLYPEIEFTFKRKFKLNAAKSHVNYTTPLAPVFTY